MTEEKKVINKEQEVHFTNFSGEDFRGQWASKYYPLKAGKTYYLPFYLAEHFAKHLVDRELNKEIEAEIKNMKVTDKRARLDEKSAIYNSTFSNIQKRQEMMDRCVVIPGDTSSMDVVMPKEVPVREVVLQSQKRIKDYIDRGEIDERDAGAAAISNSARPPKEKKDEASFEGLQDEKS